MSKYYNPDDEILDESFRYPILDDSEVPEGWVRDTRYTSYPLYYRYVADKDGVKRDLAYLYIGNLGNGSHFLTVRSAFAEGHPAYYSLRKMYSNNTKPSKQDMLDIMNSVKLLIDANVFDSILVLLDDSLKEGKKRKKPKKNNKGAWGWFQAVKYEPDGPNFIRDPGNPVAMAQFNNSVSGEVPTSGSATASGGDAGSSVGMGEGLKNSQVQKPDPVEYLRRYYNDNELQRAIDYCNDNDLDLYSFHPIDLETLVGYLAAPGRASKATLADIEDFNVSYKSNLQQLDDSFYDNDLDFLLKEDWYKEQGYGLPREELIAKIKKLGKHYKFDNLSYSALVDIYNRENKKYIEKTVDLYKGENTHIEDPKYNFDDEREGLYVVEDWYETIRTDEHPEVIHKCFIKYYYNGCEYPDGESEFVSEIKKSRYFDYLKAWADDDQSSFTEHDTIYKVELYENGKLINFAEAPNWEPIEVTELQQLDDSLSAQDVIDLYSESIEQFKNELNANIEEQEDGFLPMRYNYHISTKDDILTVSFFAGALLITDIAKIEKALYAIGIPYVDSYKAPLKTFSMKLKDIDNKYNKLQPLYDSFVSKNDTPLSDSVYEEVVAKYGWSRNDVYYIIDYCEDKNIDWQKLNGDEFATMCAYVLQDHPSISIIDAVAEILSTYTNKLTQLEDSLTEGYDTKRMLIYKPLKELYSLFGYSLVNIAESGDWYSVVSKVRIDSDTDVDSVINQIYDLIDNKFGDVNELLISENDNLVRVNFYIKKDFEPVNNDLKTLDDSLNEELYEITDKQVQDVIDILNKYDFTLDLDIKHDNPYVNAWGDVHIQVINEKSKLDMSKSENDIYTDMKTYLKPSMFGDIDRYEEKSGCPISWNFGVGYVTDGYGKVTGGIDIRKSFKDPSTLITLDDSLCERLKMNEDAVSLYYKLSDVYDVHNIYHKEDIDADGDDIIVFIDKKTGLFLGYILMVDYDDLVNMLQTEIDEGKITEDEAVIKFEKVICDETGLKPKFYKEENLVKLEDSLLEQSVNDDYYDYLKKMEDVKTAVKEEFSDIGKTRVFTYNVPNSDNIVLTCYIDISEKVTDGDNPTDIVNFVSDMIDLMFDDIINKTVTINTSNGNKIEVDLLLPSTFNFLDPYDNMESLQVLDDSLQESKETADEVYFGFGLVPFDEVVSYIDDGWAIMQDHDLEGDTYYMVSPYDYRQLRKDPEYLKYIRYLISKQTAKRLKAERNNVPILGNNLVVLDDNLTESLDDIKLPKYWHNDEEARSKHVLLVLEYQEDPYNIRLDKDPNIDPVARIKVVKYFKSDTVFIKYYFSHDNNIEHIDYEYMKKLDSPTDDEIEVAVHDAIDDLEHYMVENGYKEASSNLVQLEDSLNEKNKTQRSKHDELVDYLYQYNYSDNEISYTFKWCDLLHIDWQNMEPSEFEIITGWANAYDYDLELKVAVDELIKTYGNSNLTKLNDCYTFNGDDIL